MLPHPQSSIRSDYVRVCFDGKFPVPHYMSVTHLIISVDTEGPEEGQSVRAREAFVVEYVRTTCLFSKLQEDVVSRKRHEQCSD